LSWQKFTLFRSLIFSDGYGIESSGLGSPVINSGSVTLATGGTGILAIGGDTSPVSNTGAITLLAGNGTGIFIGSANSVVTNSGAHHLRQRQRDRHPHQRSEQRHRQQRRHQHQRRGRRPAHACSLVDVSGTSRCAAVAFVIARPCLKSSCFQVFHVLKFFKKRPS
jgi:hypothetical protein